MNIVKLSRYHHECAKRRRECSSYSFLILALEGVSGKRYEPTALYHRGKDPQYPLYRRLGAPQSRSGHRGYSKILYLCRVRSDIIALHLLMQRFVSDIIFMRKIGVRTPAEAKDFSSSLCVQTLQTEVPGSIPGHALGFF
jgi:hypothetical protein